MPYLPTDLNPGAEVFSSDGHKLGELLRLVLRRQDLTITHVVVDIGFLRSGRGIWQGGYGLDYDRIVPVDTIASATGKRIDLKMTAEQFKGAPEYTQEGFEQPQDLSPGDYDIADVAEGFRHFGAILNSTADTWIVERLNKPLDEVEITEGMGVWRQEPHEKLGEVDRGLFEPETGRLQALVIRRGFLLTRDVILPARYISEIIDEVSVRVDITDDELSKLREYAG